MREYIKHNFKNIKKNIIVLTIILSFNLSAFAIIENDNKIKISLEEAMGLALDGNIELQKQYNNIFCNFKSRLFHIEINIYHF